MGNGLDAVWGSHHVRITGVIGILALVTLLLGSSLAWLVWTVGTDHRGMMQAFGEVRKERQGQFEDIKRGQTVMDQRLRETLDELTWIMSRTPQELQVLRQKMQEPTRFRR